MQASNATPGHSPAAPTPAAAAEPITARTDSLAFNAIPVSIATAAEAWPFVNFIQHQLRPEERGGPMGPVLFFLSVYGAWDQAVRDGPLAPGDVREANVIQFYAPARQALAKVIAEVPRASATAAASSVVPATSAICSPLPVAPTPALSVRRTMPPWHIPRQAVPPPPTAPAPAGAATVPPSPIVPEGSEDCDDDDDQGEAREEMAADLDAGVFKKPAVTHGSRNGSEPVLPATAGPLVAPTPPVGATAQHGAPEPNAEPTFADCELFYQEVLSHVSRKSIFTHGALASLLDEVAAFHKTGDDRKARLALHWYGPAKKEFAELRARGPALTPQHLAAAGSSVATPAQQAQRAAAPGPARVPGSPWVPTATPTSAAPSASNDPTHRIAAFAAAPAAGQPAGQPAQPSQDSRVPVLMGPAGTPSSAMPPSPTITSTLVSGALLGTPDVRDRTAAGSPSGPPPTMSDALKRAVLGAAPRIFALERMTSGMVALLFHLISKERLYELDGFASMEEYAQKRLGVQGEANLKVFRRAGRAMWDNFPGLAMRAVEAVAAGVTFVTPTELSLPCPASASSESFRELSDA